MNFTPNFIILSAGNSKRMGIDKGLLNYHGIPWILKQTKEALVHCNEVFVVANTANIEIYKKILNHSKIKIILNPLEQSHVFDSIKIALNSSDHASGSFVSPVDTPITHSLIKKMLEICDQESLAVIPTYHQKKGHPVFLTSKLIRQIKANEFKEDRLDLILHKIANKVIQIQTNEMSAVLNINTTEDWENLIS